MSYIAMTNDRRAMRLTFRWLRWMFVFAAVGLILVYAGGVR